MTGRALIRTRAAAADIGHARVTTATSRSSHTTALWRVSAGIVALDARTCTRRDRSPPLSELVSRTVTQIGQDADSSRPDNAAAAAYQSGSYFLLKK